MSLDYKHANEILTIKPNHSLWLGDCSSAQDIEWIHKNNIRMVITAAAGVEIKYDASIRHYRYALHDVKTENMLRYFDDAAEKIDKGIRWGSVLVHCGAGVSRSATLVIAYLIKFHKMTFLEALKFTKSKRPQVCPNLGFQLQLKKYATPKLLNSINNTLTNNTLQNNSTLTTTQNFYKKPEWANLTLHNNPNKLDINQSFPQISRIGPKSPNTDVIKGETQPRGWRITYNLKPQFVSSSLDPKKETENYIKNIAKFRFGASNASKWGIY